MEEFEELLVSIENYWKEVKVENTHQWLERYRVESKTPCT